ncbi:MAG: topoisomerase [Deltaproteobacteria bacterium]|nr:MAG: topoisomerase [Deltaproteobacteria bacterium]
MKKRVVLVRFYACAAVLMMLVLFSASSFAAEGAKIDLNTASVETLAELKYVGEKLAERIVQYRTNVGAFKKVDDLTAVKGIGPKILNANRDRLMVSPSVSKKRAAPKKKAVSKKQTASKKQATPKKK